MSAEPIIAPLLDHVVVNARDRFDEAALCYRRLGFDLTPLGRHTLGSVNRLAVFARDYLELVGIDPAAAAPRADLLRTPMGLNGLVFATDDAVALYRGLAAQGAPVEPPAEFSRPVILPDRVAEARFHVVRIAAGHVSYGRVSFFPHLTRDLVWGAAGRSHANGASALLRMVIAARDPAAAGALYRRLFGAASVAAVAGGVTLAMGAARLEILTPDHVARQFGERPADDAMAALTLRTRALAETRRALAAGGVSSARDEPGRIVVPAAAGFGAILEFV
jgi:hypothetical protein